MICSRRHRAGAHDVAISHLRPRRRSRAAAQYWRGNASRRKLPRLAGHRVVRGHYRHNPKSGGGMGIGTIALIGVGAFFLLRSGALGGVSTMFGGQPAVPGYTPIGGNAYRNDATGQIAYRQPTGQMTTAPTGGTIVPSGGAAWTAPLVQAGVASIPLLGSGLASMIRGLFSGSVTNPTDTSPQPAGTTGVISETGATSTTSPDILAIPEPGGPVAPAPASIYDWFGGAQVGAQPAPSDIFADVAVPQTSLDLTLAPDTSTWFGTPEPALDYAADLYAF
jgi:hypothetical protein